MTSTTRFSSRLVPAAGAATLAATAVAGWAAHAPSAGAQVIEDSGDLTAGGRALDGTYEACSAYFGFGKEEAALGVVDFDVSDDNGSDGVAHDVDTDTNIVLVLENDLGEVLECLPEEITETEWNDEVDRLRSWWAVSGDLPAWPGPGRFAYPTLSGEPTLDGFGRVTAVGFRVAGTPDGHSLVSPTGVVPLVQHFTFPLGEYATFQQDPQLLADVEAAQGAQAAQDLAAALDACDDDLQATIDPVPAAGLDHLMTVIDEQPWAIDPADVCNDLEFLNAHAAFVVAVRAAATYQEPIVLAVDETPTTTTTTTAVTTTTEATVDATSDAPGATPIRAEANYTG